MKLKKFISAVTAVSIVVSSLFTTSYAEETTAITYTYNYEKYSHIVSVVESEEDTESGLYASANTPLYLDNVTYGTTTYAELKELYTGLSVTGFFLDECSVDSLTADDFELYTYLMYDNWTWTQVNDSIMTFEDLGLSDSSIIQAIGYILHVKDSALVDSGIENGDVILVNSGNAQYYEYSYAESLLTITVAEGGSDLASGQYAATNGSIALPDVSYGTTTFGELKSLYAGMSVNDFSFSSCSVDNLTADDFEMYVYIMTGDSYSWNQSWNNQMLFSELSVADSDVVQQIGYVVRIKESTLVNLGLSIGDTVILNIDDSVTVTYSDGVFDWDAVDGTDHYLIKTVYDSTIVFDNCIVNSSANLVKTMAENSFPTGTYTVMVFSVATDGTETLIGTAEFEHTLLATEYEGNIFYYEDNGDGTAMITDISIGNPDAVIPSEIDGTNVTSIGDSAFDFCDGLTSIVIPDSVTSIGNNAFWYCTGLTSITIPDSVTSIGDKAFYYCTGLTSITIGDGVTSIGDKTFYYCTGLTSITIGDNVTGIGDYAFAVCDNLTSITIPDSVISIGDSAFYHCTGLTSITIGNNVTDIGWNVFSECTGLTSINVNSGSTAYTSIDGILFTNDKKTIVAYPAGKTETSYIIPNSVTNIGDNAFSGCSGLTDITIGDNVTSIGVYAFYDTGYYKDQSNWENELLYINNWLIDADNDVTSTNIKEGTIGIADYAFYECDSLTSAIIPDSVTSINSHVFAKCHSITSITIPDSVTSIGDSAFYDCTNLTSITIPDSVTNIGDFAFCDCIRLTSVTIPNSVTNIGSSAFNTCYRLASITIGDGITSIGNGAFYYCKSLTDVYYIGAEEQWNSIDIESGNDYLSNATIHYNYKIQEESPIEQFVERLYVTMLGRASDPTGKANHVSSLNNGKTAAEVSAKFVTSAELKNKNLSNDEFVLRMYQTFMNRTPSEKEITRWATTLENGCTYEYVLKKFVASAEFKNLCAEYGITAGTYKPTGNRDYDENITAFVSRMYTTLLGRSFDASGLNNNAGIIINGGTAADVGKKFVMSGELTNLKLSNDEFVKRMYQTFLNRTPAAKEITRWATTLENGCSYGYILKKFVASAEFNTLCTKYNIKAGEYATTENRDYNENITAYVSRMYTKALGRSFDIKGLNNNTGRLITGEMTAAEVAEYFILSKEFVNKKLTDEQYVTTLYSALFNRAPDAGGKTRWLNKLATGTSREEVLKGFTTAAEFKNLVVSFGL